MQFASGKSLADEIRSDPDRYAAFAAKHHIGRLNGVNPTEAAILAARSFLDRYYGSLTQDDAQELRAALDRFDN